ncbi:MAG: A/G-specific adenine glycosylase [Dysgonamonadaceae bacterium]|jgi:A/G-specific adenine glycosylase|nr:A/G-specific adenine glycosylase [Dysgonamonadaceae bacterium]
MKLLEEETNKYIFSRKLIDWYDANKRELPWRGISDPYRIWLSEIILQQTRVNQGMDYFLRMIERFPDVKTLAEATEDEVLKYWQGLGYYSRARNLHAAAQMIVRDFGGQMPSDYGQLIQLKGIGEYTAAAIASFAQNAPHPVVDGNVFRFLSRYFGISEPVDTGKGKKLFTSIAGDLMDRSRAGLFNQAIMEFGALQCVPGQPDCRNCPFSDACVAFETNEIARYPVKQNKTTTQNRYFHYFHVRTGNYTYICKRTQKDIWHNLYEFPMIETDRPMPFEELQQEKSFRELFPDIHTPIFRLQIANKKHVLTHRILWANFYEVTLEVLPDSFKNFIRVAENTLEAYAVHRLMQAYFEKE